MSRCYALWKCRCRAELENACDGVPAGATPIIIPRKLQVEWRWPEHWFDGERVGWMPGRGPSK
jgi:hypothetical protein